MNSKFRLQLSMFGLLSGVVALNANAVTFTEGVLAAEIRKTLEQCASSAGCVLPNTTENYPNPAGPIVLTNTNLANDFTQNIPASVLSGVSTVVARMDTNGNSIYRALNCEKISRYLVTLDAAVSKGVSTYTCKAASFNVGGTVVDIKKTVQNGTGTKVETYVLNGKNYRKTTSSAVNITPMGMTYDAYDKYISSFNADISTTVVTTLTDPIGVTTGWIPVMVDGLPIFVKGNINLYEAPTTTTTNTTKTAFATNKPLQILDDAKLEVSCNGLQYRPADVLSVNSTGAWADIVIGDSQTTTLANFINDCKGDLTVKLLNTQMVNSAGTGDLDIWISRPGDELAVWNSYIADIRQTMVEVRRPYLDALAINDATTDKIKLTNVAINDYSNIIKDALLLYYPQNLVDQLYEKISDTDCAGPCYALIPAIRAGSTNDVWWNTWQSYSTGVDEIGNPQKTEVAIEQVNFIGNLHSVKADPAKIVESLNFWRNKLNNEVARATNLLDLASKRQVRETTYLADKVTSLNNTLTCINTNISNKTTLAGCAI